MESSWWVYVLRCADGSLYTGITTDPDRRVDEHGRGVASRYTRARRPVRLVHVEPSPSRSEALRREAAIKRLSREDKLILVSGTGGRAVVLAEQWIRRLDLRPHPEGGWYRETWRSSCRVVGRSTPVGERSAGTSIYYLLREGDVSRLHRIRSDEVWMFHDGGPLDVHVFDPVEGHRSVRLGLDPATGALPQTVVPGGAWFGAEPVPGSGFCLVGCVVAPGFEFADLELAPRARLKASYPDQADVVERLTADR